MLLDRVSPALVLVAAYLLVPVVGYLDYVSGPEFGFSIFYLVPVAGAAWSGRRLHGTIIATLGTVAWYLADRFAAVYAIHPAIPVWNALMRCGIFMVVVLSIAALRRMLERERELARTDALTGLTNARAFIDIAHIEVTRAQRYGRPLTMAYLDLDNFKKVNDEQGHQAGDEVLRRVAGVLLGGFRNTDTVARVGGDEFAVLLPETTGEAAGEVLARTKARLLTHLHDLGSFVTVSIGAATFKMPPEDVEEMIRRADTLMYAAKESGKNTIRHVVFDGEQLGTVAMMTAVPGDAVRGKIDTPKPVASVNGKGP